MTENVQAITRARFSNAETQRNIFHAIVPEDISIEDVCKPSYFNNVVKQIRPFDRIEVLNESGSWWCELLVTYLVSGQMKLALLNKVDIALPKSSDSDVDGFIVNWGGPAQKHRVIDPATKDVLKHGFGSKAEAEAWARQHKRNLAA